MKRVFRRYRRQKRPKTQGNPDAVAFNPRQVRRDHIVPQIASLEGVAVEIQQAILHQMPDLQALRALISASPSYLSAYRSQRHSIMSSILLRDIHPDVLFDALAIVDALKLPRNYDDYVPQLKAFVEQYKITGTSLHVALEALEPSTRENLGEFHLSVMDATKDFCDHTLSTHPVTRHGLNDHRSLSPHEVRRIHRAFYRYELFIVLFREPEFYLEEQDERRRDRSPGRIRLALERNSIRSLDSQDKSFLFLALFKAWEVEEIACVRDYIRHRYDELYKECKSDLQETMERGSQHGVAPWDDSPTLPSEMYGDEPCHEHYLALGLSFFHSVMKASHEEQVRVLRENSGTEYWSLSSVLEEHGLEYGACTDEVFLAFEGDGDRDGPNAAWVWSAGNEVEIRYYQYEKKGLREWGYVMWDKKRLDQWNILNENPHDYFSKNHIALA